MTRTFGDAERDLVDLLADSARGPRRNGLFATWLVVRLCEGLVPPDQIGPRAHRKRTQALERRLSSLSMPPRLRRALNGAIRGLRDATPSEAMAALAGLRPVVRETLGPQAEKALSVAPTAPERDVRL